VSSSTCGSETFLPFFLFLISQAAGARPKLIAMTNTVTPCTPLDDALLLRIPDVARALSISTGLTWQLVRAGSLESVRIGQRCRRVPRSAVERAIREGLPSPAAACEKSSRFRTGTPGNQALGFPERKLDGRRQPARE
jgi:excisionase family DNA binding protein